MNNEVQIEAVIHMTDYQDIDGLEQIKDKLEEKDYDALTDDEVVNLMDVIDDIETTLINRISSSNYHFDSIKMTDFGDDEYGRDNWMIARAFLAKRYKTITDRRLWKFVSTLSAWQKEQFTQLGYVPIRPDNIDELLNNKV